MPRKNKTHEQFLIDAFNKHGDKFEYLTKYINNKTYINIKCNKCFYEFNQTPDNHLKGKGCAKCAGNMKKSFETFVEQANNKHNSKYKYFEYKNCRTQIPIQCPHHGIFYQTPSDHINKGNGCPDCGIILISKSLSKSFETFVEQANKKHNNKFKYFEYKGDNIKIPIECPEHGIFEQTPSAHLQKQGCNKCSCKGYSKMAIDWIKSIEENEGITIQHYLSDQGEYRIPGTNFKADGYCKETNTIYEFNGDYFHGNPKLYCKNDYNKLCKKTFGELYEATIQREQIIKDLGYNLIVMWESDFSS